MEAVDNDEKIELRNPRGGHPNNSNNDMIEDTIEARELFEKIVKQTWKTGEPGYLFIDRINEKQPFPIDNPNDEYYIPTTNPCFTEDTYLYTTEGIKQVSELKNKNDKISIEIDSRISEESKKTTKRGVFQTGVKDVYNLKTKEGYEIKLTLNHKVMTDNGWKKVKNLKKGEEIHIFKKENPKSFGNFGNYDLGVVLGWIMGDGWFSDRRVGLGFYHQDKELSNFFCDKVNNIIKSKTESLNNTDYGEVSIIDSNNKDLQIIKSQRLKRFINKIGLTKDKRKTIPKKVFLGNYEFQKGFLQSLFSADGCPQGNKEKGFCIRLNQSNKKMLQDVQKILLNFGIFSKIYKRRENKKRKLPNGKGG
ncbi:MAG: LAGLIDADG family homing endonuclease, partial [Candidatus Woesearchaeota archaeon]